MFTFSNEVLTRLHSRQAIKKYVKANNKIGDITDAQFNSHVNRAIQQGVEKGHFDQPKGESYFRSGCVA